MRANAFLEKLRNNEKPLGTFVATGSSCMVECIGRTGIDYIIIDNEHSPVEAETSSELIRAAELSGLTPFARVREISRPAILKLLDVGAQGLIIPNVKTVEEVKELVSYCKYDPIGNRGYARTRKDGWGMDSGMNMRETMDYYNENVLLIPQCETVEALEAIDEIAAVDGVDGIFIGPSDLSISMGMPGDFDNPFFKETMLKIRDAVHSAGKFCIFYGGTPEKTISGFADGFDSVTYSLDALIFINRFKETVDYIRKNIQ